MANFKLCIADPKSGKAFQTEAKDQAAQGFIGMNLGESVKGEAFDMPGYEFQITGGSDFCGFPMRRGILGVRKKIILLGGVGFKAKKTEKGIKRRKTVCGHKINENIVQLNLKVTKEGGKKLADMFGKKEGEKKEEVKEAPKEAPKKEEAKPKEEKKPEAKEEKKAEEEPKAEEMPKEEKKAEEKPKVEEEPKEEKKPEAIQEKTEEKPKAEENKEEEKK